MAHIDEDLVQKKAYALWEAEGKPDGRHDAHWDQAYQEVALAENAAVLGEPEETEAPVEKVAPTPAAVDGDAKAEAAPKRRRKAT